MAVTDRRMNGSISAHDRSRTTYDNGDLAHPVGDRDVETVSTVGVVEKSYQSAFDEPDGPERGDRRSPIQLLPGVSSQEKHDASDCAIRRVTKRGVRRSGPTCRSQRHEHDARYNASPLESRSPRRNAEWLSALTSSSAEQAHAITALRAYVMHAAIVRAQSQSRQPRSSGLDRGHPTRRGLRAGRVAGDPATSR
jgi:hypothetical protein